MEVIRDGDPCPRPPEGSVITIGAYDGVHLGHRAVIAEVKLRAAELGARSAVVTFDRHPASVVRPESAPMLLTDLDQRLSRIKATGVDYTVVLVVRNQYGWVESYHRQLVKMMRLDTGISELVGSVLARRSIHHDPAAGAPMLPVPGFQSFSSIRPPWIPPPASQQEKPLM